MVPNNLKLVVGLEQVLKRLEALAPVEENLGDGEEEGDFLLDVHPSQTFEGSSWIFQLLLLLDEGDGSTKDQGLDNNIGHHVKLL